MPFLAFCIVVATLPLLRPPLAPGWRSCRDALVGTFPNGIPSNLTVDPSACVGLIQKSVSTPEGKQLGSKLLTAVWRSDLSQVKSLVHRGADVNFRSNMFDGTSPEAVRRSTTALIVSTEEGNIRLVRFLLHKGAKVNAFDSEGNTSLHEASAEGHVEIVRVLLRAGADCRVRNIYGSTPLELAEHSAEHAEVISRILQHWAKGHHARKPHLEGTRRRASRTNAVTATPGSATALSETHFFRQALTC